MSKSLQNENKEVWRYMIPYLISLEGLNSSVGSPFHRTCRDADETHCIITQTILDGRLASSRVSLINTHFTRSYAFSIFILIATTESPFLGSHQMYNFLSNDQIIHDVSTLTKLVWFSSTRTDIKVLANS